MKLFFSDLVGLFLVLNFVTASNAQSIKKVKFQVICIYMILLKKNQNY